MLRLLLVDDEACARRRLQDLVQECRAPSASVTGQAGHAARAMELLQQQPFDVVLLDVRLPGADGLTLAQALCDLPAPPQVVFVTAFSDHAVQAFALDAADYLTKPVRRDRLEQALRKAQGRLVLAEQPASLLIQERGRWLRLPVSQVVYLKAELKYVTVRTATASHMYEGTLGALQARYPGWFLRVHRNALVARSALQGLEAGPPKEGAATWAARLAGVPERIPVSRRMLAGVRAALNH